MSILLVLFSGGNPTPVPLLCKGAVMQNDFEHLADTKGFYKLTVLFTLISTRKEMFLLCLLEV